MEIKSKQLNCNNCKQLFITHDPKRRWGCKFFGFKSNNIPSIEVKDSAVDAICHGADLGIPGVASVSKKMKRGQLISINSSRGETIALARATVNSEEIVERANSKGKVAKLERVIMKRGTYPREWKSK